MPAGGRRGHQRPAPGASRGSGSRGRGPAWAEFLRSQARAILAAGFFTVTLLNGATLYVLAIIEHASQRVRILGVIAHPDNRRVLQVARNLIMEVGEHAEAVTFLIRDGDTKFTAAFDRMFADAGLKILRSPVRAPRANAIMERWIGSCRRECRTEALVLSLWLRRALTDSGAKLALAVSHTSTTTSSSSTPSLVTPPCSGGWPPPPRRGPSAPRMPGRTVRRGRR